MKEQEEIFQKKLMSVMFRLTTYSEVLANFVIFGSPATAKNSKTPTKSGALVGSKAASDYANIFSKQIERYKEYIEGIPFDDPALLWVFQTYYSNYLSDVSVDLIFDMLEYHGLLTNDRTLRNFLVIGEEFDKDLPRIEITILGKRNG